MKRVKLLLSVLLLALVASVSVNALDAVAVSVEVPAWGTQFVDASTKTKATNDSHEVTNINVYRDKEIAFDLYINNPGDVTDTFKFGSTGDYITFTEGVERVDGVSYTIGVRTKYVKYYKVPVAFVWWYY